MILQVAPGEGIERGERLVQQQHFRLRHQRAGDRHPLRLPAGKLARPGIGLVGEADARERGRDLLAPCAGGQVGQAEADIVGDAQPGQQPRLLEDDADLGMRRQDRGAIECHRARARAVEPGDGAKQRGLAAAGAADDGDDLAGTDLGGKALQRMHAVGIDLADLVEREHQPAPPCLPNASCQRRNGAAATSISQSVSLPRMAKITIAARICAGLPSCWPSIRR